MCMSLTDGAYSPQRKASHDASLAPEQPPLNDRDVGTYSAYVILVSLIMDIGQVLTALRLYVSICESLRMCLAVTVKVKIDVGCHCRRVRAARETPCQNRPQGCSAQGCPLTNWTLVRR